jgi:hypothetical protein
LADVVRTKQTVSLGGDQSGILHLKTDVVQSHFTCPPGSGVLEGAGAGAVHENE